MEKIIEKARAKVNISLDVLRKREDGYHEMRMINHSILLEDTVILKPKPQGLSLSCNLKELPLDQRNLVMLAATKLQKKFNVNQGAALYLEKKIPMEAGLAGGSSDAAATLRGLVKLWNLKLTTEELMGLGLEIGADVPYCLVGKTALVEGIGEKITLLTPLKKLWVVVVKPQINSSTPKAFKALDRLKNSEHPNIFKLRDLLESGDYSHLSEVMGNVFEAVLFLEFPEIKEIKEALKKTGALAATMTGSGSTVIGYFEEKNAAKKAFDVFSKKQICFLTETC